MPSPFPGMDPWLEYHWGDVHTRFVTYAADQLQPRLPADLRVRVEERVAVEAEKEDRFLIPDIRVVERPTNSGLFNETEGGLAVMEPVVSRVPDEDVTERFLEIREFRGGPLICVIELLSPTNKSGGGKAKYAIKRKDLVRAGVTLVEIDLLRQGDIPWYAEAGWYADDEPYHVVVRPGWDTSELRFYPISLRNRLPAFRIPLRRPDESAVLELQPIIDQIYHRGTYEDIDYSEQPPGPPWPSADQEWIKQQLQTRRTK
jgi:hypothetical protein